MKTKLTLGLLPKILIAIALGIGCSFFMPEWGTRIFVTFNDLFAQYLGFAIPLIILGLVAPGIAELGNGAGKLLGITVMLAYGSTIFSGLLSYFTSVSVFPIILDNTEGLKAVAAAEQLVIQPYFSIAIPPVMDIMSTLVLAFILGLGLSAVKGDVCKRMLMEFREVMTQVITVTIIPLLPLYIFGIFLKMGVEGQVGVMMGLFLKVIIVIFVMHVALLLIQFFMAGVVSGKNPFRLLKNMLPAYMTALGTQSSAATIPVTLQQTLKNKVKPEIAGFVIPLCATIHLSGSTLKIVSCAVAIMYMMGMPTPPWLFLGFILLLGITMVAAPGVPGGAIMAALAVLSSVLGFDETLQGLMIALYIAMDSFGTAANVTGDGAIAVVVDKIFEKKQPNESIPEKDTEQI